MGTGLPQEACIGAEPFATSGCSLCSDGKIIYKQGDTMSIKIGSYTFEGPYSSSSSIEDRSGVYAVLCYDGASRPFLLDVGESSEVRTRIQNHDRRHCWYQHCNGTIKYAVYYTPHMQGAGRRSIEQEIRDDYEPPCGTW